MEPERITPQWAVAHWEANAEAWTAHARAGFDRYRDLVNTPAFLRHARADAATTADEPYVADTRVAPLFLHLRGRKP